MRDWRSSGLDLDGEISATYLPTHWFPFLRPLFSLFSHCFAVHCGKERERGGEIAWIVIDFWNVKESLFAFTYIWLSLGLTWTLSVLLLVVPVVFGFAWLGSVNWHMALISIMSSCEV
ncbi:hypothetical protein IWX46DRAFT_389516 [Phyllosticta citricarpa]|uniref:Uncharacterized protein n=1 Tax=Phyllosticta citricarpa TaxID=55181 RepID=A0ABR1MK66_9PEZI